MRHPLLRLSSERDKGSSRCWKCLVDIGLANQCALPMAWHYPLPRRLNLCVAPLTGATPFLLAQERCAKEGHPDIRVSLRETSLAPAPLRGPAYMGHPWPNKPLAASMRLAPLHDTSARPPDGTGARACEISTGSSLAASAFAFELRSHRRRPSHPLQEAEWNRHVRGRAGSHERHGCRESCDGPGTALRSVLLEW